MEHLRVYLAALRANAPHVRRALERASRQALERAFAASMRLRPFSRQLTVALLAALVLVSGGLLAHAAAGSSGGSGPGASNTALTGHTAATRTTAAHHGGATPGATATTAANQRPPSPRKPGQATQTPGGQPGQPGGTPTPAGGGAYTPTPTLPPPPGPTATPSPTSVPPTPTPTTPPASWHNLTTYTGDSSQNLGTQTITGTWRVWWKCAATPGVPTWSVTLSFTPGSAQTVTCSPSQMSGYIDCAGGVCTSSSSFSAYLAVNAPNHGGSWMLVFQQYS